MTDAQNDEAALKEETGHTTGNPEIKYGRQIWAGGYAIMHFWAVDIGEAVAAANARRGLACWKAFSRLTTLGIERFADTPEQVEAALINADAARLRIEALEAALREWVARCEELDSKMDLSPSDAGRLNRSRYILSPVPVSPTNAQQL